MAASVVLMGAALAFFAAGCAPSKPEAPTTGASKGRSVGVTAGQPTSADNLNAAKPAIKKTCDIPPPALSAPTSTNAEGKEYKYPASKIFTSSQAIPKLWAEARKWAPDAKIRGGYRGNGAAFTTTDPKDRAHYGSARGAEWAWSATFYSPSKKEEVYLAYIDEEAGGSIPQAVREETFQADEKSPPSIYAEHEDMLDSCVVYGLAKAAGFDDQANYHIYMTGDTRSASKYPGRKTWVVEERSRTDTDGGKEILGKVVNTYLFDAITGELLEKVAGRTYSF